MERWASCAEDCLLWACDWQIPVLVFELPVWQLSCTESVTMLCLGASNFCFIFWKANQTPQVGANFQQLCTVPHRTTHGWYGQFTATPTSALLSETKQLNWNFRDQKLKHCMRKKALHVLTFKYLSIGKLCWSKRPTALLWTAHFWVTHRVLECCRPSGQTFLTWSREHRDISYGDVLIKALPCFIV